VTLPLSSNRVGEDVQSCISSHSYDPLRVNKFYHDVFPADTKLIEGCQEVVGTHVKNLAAAAVKPLTLGVSQLLADTDFCSSPLVPVGSRKVESPTKTPSRKNPPVKPGGGGRKNTFQGKKGGKSKSGTRSQSSNPKSSNETPDTKAIAEIKDKEDNETPDSDKNDSDSDKTSSDEEKDKSKKPSRRPRKPKGGGKRNYPGIGNSLSNSIFGRRMNRTVCGSLGSGIRFYSSSSRGDSPSGSLQDFNIAS
jgi:hypothetical protein